MIIGKRGLRRVTAFSLLSACSLSIAPAWAQSQDVDDVDEAMIEEVVVTGSRIRRDEFTSAAPLQTYNIDAARQIGISSIGDLLQRSTIANGQQINTDLNTNAGNSNASEPPPIGGVGSANIGLRQRRKMGSRLNSLRMKASGFSAEMR